MTEAKKYLQQIKLCDTHINTKLEELQHLKEMVTRITPTLKDDVVSGGGSQDKLGDAVAKIVDLQDEINREIDFYADSMHKVNDTLNQITDSDQLQVLHSRYVQYKSFEQIACEMSMTYRNVCYIHGKGLQAVNNILFGENYYG